MRRVGSGGVAVDLHRPDRNEPRPAVADGGQAFRESAATAEEVEQGEGWPLAGPSKPRSTDRPPEPGTAGAF